MSLSGDDDHEAVWGHVAESFCQVAEFRS